ncbi:2OG-Fe(II) oxygenase [Sphingomonas sp. LB-2]|uniref:2OG-Fe(II) oxygenase family protein n=1 Tax=Sphingomonas caeni TaxID=2984949 RepID=UPI00222E8826|nr:2OG-Fe(II) oxygenase [Sphingomonas caeni]MCW3846629.1 2OG-Fe(II) oxygenase [Sphingomonas caeni]
MSFPAVPPIRRDPFPHAVAEDFLDADLYRSLRDSFPECPPNSGPTGYSLFKDDAAYAALLEAQPAWRQLFDWTQSQAFVDYMLGAFRDDLAREARVDLSNARFVAHVEDRVEKEARHLAPTGLAPDALFVRTDILQGNAGYDRRPHVDHRRRAATMLIYCCDGDEAAMDGGDLVLHDAAGAPVETIRPRHNRMVMFPCVNASVHSVSPIRAQASPRNFIQITVSSSADLWDPLPEAPRPGLLARALRRIRR